MSKRAVVFLLALAAGVLPAEERLLTTAYIKDSLWEWHTPEGLEDWPIYSLQFFEDGIVSGENRDPGRTDSELFAVWEVASPSQMVLRYVESHGREVPPEKDGEILFTMFASGEIRRLEDSVYQEYAIFLGKGNAPPLVLLSEDFTVRPNLRRKVKGIEVVTMGAVFGMTTQNVRVRTAPSVKASIIKFPTLGYCPKGSYVRVLARTVQKELVQQWANYWYYVENTAQEESPRYGWMFGEFIAIPEEEVRQAEALRRPWEEAFANYPDSPQGGSEGEEADPAVYEYD